MRHKKVEKVTSNSKSEFCLMVKHEKKMDYYKNKNKRIKDIKNKLKDLENNENQNYYKSIKLKQDLEAELFKLESGLGEIEYLQNTIQILEKYMNILEIEEESSNSTDLKNEKKELILEYLKITNDEGLKNFNYESKYTYKCKYCNTELIYEENEYLCERCNYVEYGINFAEDISYKEKQNCDLKIPYKYEKENYLEEYIKRFEAKENKIIPQFIIDKVIVQLNKEGYKNLSKLNEKDMKKCLKKIGHQEYYENVINIINRINGRPKFELNENIKNTLRTMFKKIQEPFNKHKPPNRKSFFSYPYILHQFFRILGLNEFCEYFPLLKSEDKLRIQDEIFKKVVEDLAKTDTEINWVFYPTI